MDTELNKRCVELFQNEFVRDRLWHARMFWNVGRKLNPTAEELTTPKANLQELEVMLSAADMVNSQCAEDLNKTNPGRADFIRRTVISGSRPVLASI